jgi:hypothetical protein
MIWLIEGRLPDKDAPEVAIELTGSMVEGCRMPVQPLDGTLEAYVQFFGVPGNGLGQPVASNEVALLIIAGRPYTALRLTDGEAVSRWMLEPGHMAGIVLKAAA